VISPQFKVYILPVTIIVLTGLFFIQKRGTGTMGMGVRPDHGAVFACLAVFG